uniref:Uncharacterized protein n=1 Tax=Nelumbo nucifera TaxID=4432 RepID=A0A822Z7R7_NELNU|nr:TPA_asm: hypothetical protein HUJ06_014906 [Nelumbo nucifera]
MAIITKFNTVLLAFLLVVLVSLFALHEYEISKAKRNGYGLEESKLNLYPCIRAYCGGKCWCCLTAAKPMETCWPERQFCIQACPPFHPPDHPRPSP